MEGEMLLAFLMRLLEEFSGPKVPEDVIDDMRSIPGQCEAGDTGQSKVRRERGSVCLVAVVLPAATCQLVNFVSIGDWRSALGNAVGALGMVVINFAILYTALWLRRQKTTVLIDTSVIVAMCAVAAIGMAVLLAATRALSGV